MLLLEEVQYFLECEGLTDLSYCAEKDGKKVIFNYCRIPRRVYADEKSGGNSKDLQIRIQVTFLHLLNFESNL